jgi:transcriptional regulator with XRE-family HTH domain
MKDKVLIYLLEQLNLTQKDLAKICNVNIKTVNCWINGRNKTPDITYTHLNLLLDIKAFSENSIKYRSAKNG